MEYVAYNYFETLQEESLYSIVSAFIRPEFGISHAGKNDPPKKFNGGVSELCALIKGSSDLTNYTFLRSRKTKVEVTIEIQNDPRWEHSTFSLSGPARNTVEELCLSLSICVNSYLCISGVLDHGTNQMWKVLSESSACPQLLLEQVGNT